MRLHNHAVVFALLGVAALTAITPFRTQLLAGDGKPAAKPPAAKLSSWKIARSYELDGVSDHVRVDDHPDLRPASLTISAWVYTLDAKRMQPIVAKVSSKGNWCSYMLRIQGNGKLSLAIENHVADQSAHWQTDNALTSKKWHHVAATWSNTKGDVTDATIYIDGVAQEIAMNRDVGYGRDFRIAYTAEPLYIGRDEWPTGHFMGKIKDVDIIGRVLTAAEIKALAEEPQP